MKPITPCRWLTQTTGRLREPHNASTKGTGTSQVPQKVTQMTSYSLPWKAKKNSSELLGNNTNLGSQCQPPATLGCSYMSISAQWTGWRNCSDKK